MARTLDDTLDPLLRRDWPPDSALDRRAALERLAVASAALAAAACTPMRIVMHRYPEDFDASPELTRAMLRAFASAVIPGAAADDPNLTRALTDPAFPLARCAGYLAADLCNRSAGAFGGSAFALRLAEAGFSVTVLEKGPRVDPLTDFRQTPDPKHLLRYLKGISGDHLSLTYAEALGGGSPFYEMVSLRAPSRAFDLTDQSGRKLWPAGLGRTSLDPFYDIADRMLWVEQIDPALVPKSGLVFSLLVKNLGYSCERARHAVKGCVGSGFCVTGCIYGAKQSLLLNYLPQAAAAGAVVETDVEARLVEPIGEPGVTPWGGAIAEIPFRYLVVCRSRTRDHERFAYRARIVVLAAGTVGTAALLLQSRVALPRLSDHVGRNIAFNGSVKAAGLLPDTLYAEV